MSHDAPPDAERDNVVPLRRLAVPDDRSPAVPKETKTAVQRAEPLQGTIVRWQPPPRRPIFAVWIVNPDQRKSAARWAGLYVGYTTAYHAVRIPKYVLRTVIHAPRGTARAARALVRWVFDGEGRPLRRHAIETGDIPHYLKLAYLRNERARLRLWIVGIGAIVGVAVLTVSAVASPWMFYAELTTLTVLAGWNGRRQDRPFIEPAILTQEVRKLTPDIVIRAFTAAGFGAEESPVAFPQPIQRDGDGWLAIVQLPYSKKASDAIRKREDIAAGLDVDETCVFLDRIRGRDGSARLVSLWVADEDPYTQPPPVTPLLEAEQVDFWKPIPFGIDARRRPVDFSLVWTSFLVGSIPRMGKTFAARLPAAAAALDPYVRLVVFDGKGGKDWKAFSLVAHRYGSGVRRVVVEHLVAVLQELVDDMNRRYERMQDLPDDLCPEGKVTPALSHNRRMGMPLTFVAIDEVHRYLEDEEFGKLIGNLLTDLVKVGPAAGYIVELSTQKPDSAAIPSKLRDSMGARFALKTMTWQASEAVLGTGTSKTGVVATKFERSHKGVGYLLGADDTELAEQGAQIVRSHLADGTVIARICERARQLRIAAGTLAGAAAGEEFIEEKPSRRLLEDMHEVFELGEEKLWSETICSRLAERWPESYDGWDATLLANALRPYGVQTRQVWMRVADGENPNRMGVHLRQVLDALADRPLGD